MSKRKLHPRYQEFKGEVGLTFDTSQPYWEQPTRPKAGSPNVVIIYMDDLGWSDVGCYGSEIDTPNIDRLAARGLRFNNHTTPPICSSARAALLTGRNSHAVSTGWLANNYGGFPGYSGEIPLEAPTLPETLRAAGYATVMVGKWHNSPHGVLPNSSWPTYRGFDRFYGFLEGETSFFTPARIMHNNIVAPIDEYSEDYYATDDWTDKAIEFVTDIYNQDPALPFFLYVANNAVHGPLQAPDDVLEKYRGRFDEGWDVLRARRLERQIELGIVPPDTRLAQRDPRVPAWVDLPNAQKELFTRHMEAYAAVLDVADRNVGRLIDQLELMDVLDNTLIVFSSDNGGTGSAGPEGTINYNRQYAGLKPLPLEEVMMRSETIGGDKTTPLYPTGWGQVSNAPFPSYKTYTGAGGRRVSMIVSWPERLTDFGSIRTQFTHVIDLMPTIAELTGVDLLEVSHGKSAEKPQGVSFAPVLLDENAPSTRREQYFECWSNRAFCRDEWVAVSLQVRGEKIDFDNWTLHNHKTDFSETTDLAADFPDKLNELVEAFDEAAWENLVFPLDNRTRVQKDSQLPANRKRPAAITRRFLPGSQTIHRKVIVPLIADRNFSIQVRLDQEEDDEGVLVAIGDVSGGLIIYIEDGRLRTFYNGFGEYTELHGPELPPGISTAVFAYEALGERRGQGRLSLGDADTGWADMSPSLLYGFHEGMDIGLDRRGPVHWELKQRKGAFRFTGRIIDVVVNSGAFAPDSPMGCGALNKKL